MCHALSRDFYRDQEEKKEMVSFRFRSIFCEKKFVNFLRVIVQQFACRDFVFIFHTFLINLIKMKPLPLICRKSEEIVSWI